MDFILPRRGRGRPTFAANARYETGLKAFCAGIMKLRSGLDFPVGSRGWGYVCESHNLITKDDIDLVERLINDCRKSGDLPLDICSVDEERAFDHVQDIDDTTPEEEAEWIVNWVHRAHCNFWPESFWQEQDYYLQMVVEKSTLKGLFSEDCAKFFVPLATASGWSDINMRADMMRRFSYWEVKGKRPVLLYCGDHDPGGLNISNFLRSNMGELSRAVGWSPDSLIIDRFGLNYDFIQRHRLTWIDNLITGCKSGPMKGVCLSNPDHNDHRKEYVQSYIRQFDVRKVEGEALVKAPKAARKLCRGAILKYVSEESLADYYERLRKPRNQVREEVLRLLGEELRS
jgi:hypothetical protein